MLPHPDASAWDAAAAAFAKMPPVSEHHAVPVSFTGPALHPTQVRAYALLAAAQLTAPTGLGAHQHDFIARWESAVLRTAARFEPYITGPDQTPESEELP